MLIFQSTLPREERPQTLYAFLSFQYFNPRSRERSDFLVLTSKRLILYFNPRSHERSDLCNISLVYIVEYFNPRSHERSDTTCDRLARGSYDFNPRSHERSDDSCPIKSQIPSISIHAPSRGATSIGSNMPAKSLISIHAPTRGATIAVLFKTSILLFQSTLPREERQQYCTKNLFIFIQYRQ